MSLRRMLSIVISLLVLGLSLEADASPVNIAGRSIEVLIPSGYCALGQHPAEMELVDLAQKSKGDGNQILVMFAACKELEDLRKGRRMALDNFGQILTQTMNGRVIELKGVSRSEYIQNMTAQIGGIMPEAFKRADARLKTITPAHLGMENLGLLATDANGLYVGHLATMIGEAGRPRSLLGVSALTFAKELSFTINIVQAYSKLPDLRGLLARQQTVTANFVRANGN